MYKRTTWTGLSGLLAAVLLAVSCADPVGPRPEGRGPGAPRFDVAASGGIALDQLNGKRGETTTIWQGFHPTNPHLGDAIVVTFYWIGSTNNLTRVYDHLGDASFTPVGNTYNLVEYVTAGGISMATYVATNVQNFPDPNDPSTGVVLAVRANLSDSVADGGLLISSWSGVDGVSTQALGAHHSGFGSGTSTTVADAGTIPVGAGALVYCVTMSEGLFGRFSPHGFSNIQTQTDAA